MKSTELRQSNFELLRIIAIFMVLVHHSLFEANTIGYKKIYTFDDGYVGVLLNSFCIVGVNLFILISGWFSCKNSFRKIMLILIEVMMFSGVAYIIATALGLGDFGIRDMLKSMNFFNNWFVISYVLLLMVIPIIDEILANNYIIKVSLNNILRLKKAREIEFTKSTLCVFLLAFISIFLGWFKGILNVDGYNVINFIFLYVLSDWIRKKVQIYKIPSALWLIAGYILSTVLLSFLFFFVFGYLNKESTTFNTMRLMGYNNPLVIISSICLLGLFAQIKIKSKLVNQAASAVLGVFIIHGVPCISEFWRGFVLDAYQDYSYGGLIICDVVLFGILCLLSYLIKSLLISPVLRRCNGLLNSIKISYDRFL